MLATSASYPNRLALLRRPGSETQPPKRRRSPTPTQPGARLPPEHNACTVLVAIIPVNLISINFISTSPCLRCQLFASKRAAGLYLPARSDITDTASVGEATNNVQQQKAVSKISATQFTGQPNRFAHCC